MGLLRGRGGGGGGGGGGRWPRRYHVVALCFLATMSCYLERMGFPIAYTPEAEAAGVSEATKGKVLSAFYYGYSSLQIPAGWAAARYGPRVMLAAGFMGWAGATALLPLLLGLPSLLFVGRILIGAAQGLVIPSIHTTLAGCVPRAEKARAVSLSTSGMYLGSTIGVVLMPALRDWWGPRVLLLAIGMGALTWLVPWLSLQPEDLQGGLEESLSRAGHGVGSAQPHSAAADAAWAQLVAEPCVWAIALNSFTFHYALYVIMNWSPTFFKSLLGVDLADAGALKIAPYLFMFFFSNLGGIAGDWLVNTGRLSVRNTRVAINSVGFAMAAVALSWLPYVGGAAAANAQLSFALGGLGLARGGFSVNHMDIGPKFAGLIMGISNTCGTLAGVVGISLTGSMLEAGGGSSAVAGWARAMGASSALCVIGAVVFALLAEGKVIVGK